MEPITLLLVDDHSLFRKGLKALISQNELLEVIAEVGCGEEALELIMSGTIPDIILMDIKLPGIDGIETMRQIHRNRPDLRVIILSATDYDDQVLDAINSGAAGYLVKNLEPDELFCTIETVHKTGSCISKAHLDQIMDVVRDQGENPTNQEDILSQREKEVLKLVAMGLTNKEIGEYLVIQANTVKAHISNIMAKLNLHNRVELASFAISIGLVQVE